VVKKRHQKCLYNFNGENDLVVDGSLEVSRDFPGKFEDGPFVRFLVDRSCGSGKRKING